MIRCLLVVAVLLAPSGAAAQDAQPEPEPAPEPAATPADDAVLQRARQYFGQGVALTRQDRWGEALVFFQRSLDLVERPNTIFNIAGILVRLGRGREAVEHYERYLSVAPPDDPDRPAARQALEAAQAALARLRLQVFPVYATLRVDGLLSDATGYERELVLDPGEHVIDLSAPGHHREVFRVSLLPGVRGERRVRLIIEGEPEPDPGPEPAPEPRLDPLPPPSPPPPPPPSVDEVRDRTAPHALLAAGASTLGAGVFFFAWGMYDHVSVENADLDQPWDAYREAYDRAVVFVPIGFAALLLGTALTAAGVTWLGVLSLTASASSQGASLGVEGCF